MYGVVLLSSPVFYLFSHSGTRKWDTSITYWCYHHAMAHQISDPRLDCKTGTSSPCALSRARSRGSFWGPTAIPIRIPTDCDTQKPCTPVQDLRDDSFRLVGPRSCQSHPHRIQNSPACRLREYSFYTEQDTCTRDKLRISTPAFPVEFVGAPFSVCRSSREG